MSWRSFLASLRSVSWVSASSPWLRRLVVALFAARAAGGRSLPPSRWRVFRSLVRAGVAPVVAAAVVRCPAFPGRALSPAASLAWRSLGWRLSPSSAPRFAAMPASSPALAAALLSPASPGRVLPALARAVSPLAVRALV